MNEKLQEALAELINLTIQGKDFVLEQAPDVITQLLAWELTINLIGFCFGVLLLVWIPISWRMSRNGKYRVDDVPVLGIISSVLGGVLGIAFVSETLVWIKILIAPKIFLLEYAAELIG